MIESNYPTLAWVLDRELFLPTDCTECPFAKQIGKPENNDWEQCKFFCNMNKEEVWGENPACNTGQWVNVIRSELEQAGVKLHGQMFIGKFVKVGKTK
jgi:hypothetical protein